MGSGNHVVVVDVSSDEEVDSKVDREYFSWLNEVMDDKSDSTDVVEVISEIKGDVNSLYQNSFHTVDDDEDDDDCVILDSDPDKKAEEDDKLAKNDDDGDDDDDDDVLVVGQKGEIACRDFPHPRHSCAKYAFTSTSHDKYCDMCHCYVCDIRAPCPYWCIGVSTIDHCHANDKEKIWKNQREYFRTGTMPTQPSPATTTCQPPTPSIIRLSHSSLPRNQVGIRPCSSSSHVSNLSNLRTKHRSKHSIPHNHSHGLPIRQVRSLSSVSSPVIQKNRSPHVLNLRSRVSSSGARYGATNDNNIKAGLYTNAQVSQSIHHTVSIAAPTQPEMNSQLNATGYSASMTGPESNGYVRHSGQNQSGSVNCEFEANGDPFALPETPLTSADQAVQQQQQPGTNENVLQTKLSEFESWLMDNSNQAGPVSPMPGPDYGSPLTFDFETFLND